MNNRREELEHTVPSIISDVVSRIESTLNNYVNVFLETYPCHFIYRTGYNPIKDSYKKDLFLYDLDGIQYNIDGIITNESMQPLVLLESKYIRYKKHNRDKGSWICNTHTALRKRYKSIRASIAILAGSWSKTSLAMIESADVAVFLISFDVIVDILKKYGVDFNWDEKDRTTPVAAWYNYDKLSEKQKMNIAKKMADLIKDKLLDLLREILDDTKPRAIKKLSVEVLSSWGETSRESFDKKEDAIKYLEALDLDTVFDPKTFYSIFDQVDYDDE